MGKSTKTTQENKPPAYAEPLLRKGAEEGMRLYDTNAGYNVYDGPTQAPLSDVTLGGMNSLLAATGYQGAPVTNQGINSLIPDISHLIQQAKDRAAQARVQEQPAMSPGARKLLRGSYGRDVPENTDYQRINASRDNRR